MATVLIPHVAEGVREDAEGRRDDDPEPQLTCPDCGRGLQGIGGDWLACAQLDLANPAVSTAIGGLNLPSSHAGDAIVACGEQDAPEDAEPENTEASAAELTELGL